MSRCVDDIQVCQLNHINNLVYSSSVIFIFCTLVEMAIVCQLSRWERERQIGSKVLGHWLNQIRKTRKHDGKSNGSEANGLKKRFLLKPISPSGSPKSERDSATPAPDTSPVTVSDNVEATSTPRSRFVNAFKRAGTGSPSPQRTPNDITPIANATSPLTNAIEKTSIVEEDDEVDCPTNRRFGWKSFWRGIVERVTKFWCPQDREWTLTSIQVDRFVEKLRRSKI